MERVKSRAKTLGRWLISAFEFETPHLVIFKDWRLTALQMSFTFSVAAYVVIKSLLLWSVIQYEDVATGFNSWCFTSWQSAPATDSPHCGWNSSFDLAPLNRVELGGIAAYNHSCPTVTGADIMRQVGTEAQVTVWSQKQRKTLGCDGADYDALDLNGKPCFESFFMNGIEDLPLFLIHTVSASSIGIKASLLSCKIIRDGKILGEASAGANNNGWAFTLRQLLEYAGNYSLDDINEGNVVDVRPGTLIRLRHTGFILTLRFRYWNFKSWPEDYWDHRSFPWDWTPSEPQCSIEVELQPQAWGFTGADPDPEGSILKTVARIQFIGSGKFGELSWLLMVSALIEAFVLMGIASQVTLHVARCLYGEMFREVTETSYEKVVWQSEEENGDDPGLQKSGRSMFGRQRKSAFKAKHAGALDLSPSIPVDAVAIREVGLTRRTQLLLQHLAAPAVARFEGELLLQSYLERRLLGFTDFEATDALGSSNAQRLIDAAEKALSIMEDHDDETYALLEKLSRRWRLEEHGFLPETLKTAYL